MNFFIIIIIIWSLTEIKTKSSDFQGLGLKIILDTFQDTMVDFKT